MTCKKSQKFPFRRFALQTCFWFDQIAECLTRLCLYDFRTVEVFCTSVMKDINPHMTGLKHVYECSTRISMLQTHGKAETVDKNEVAFRRLNHEEYWREIYSLFSIRNLGYLSRP